MEPGEAQLGRARPAARRRPRAPGACAPRTGPAGAGSAPAPPGPGRVRSRTTSGKRSSTASACPPRPSVKSTCTAPGSRQARERATRDSARAAPARACREAPPCRPPSPSAQMRHPAGPDVDPYRQIPIRSCPLPARRIAPGAGEEAPGAGAAGDLAVRRQRRPGRSIGPHRCHAVTVRRAAPPPRCRRSRPRSPRGTAPRTACPRSPPACSPRSPRAHDSTPRTPAGAPGW